MLLKWFPLALIPLALGAVAPADLVGQQRGVRREREVDVVGQAQHPVAAMGRGAGRDAPRREDALGVQRTVAQDARQVVQRGGVVQVTWEQGGRTHQRLL